MHESFPLLSMSFLRKPLKMCVLRGDSHNVLKVDGNQITISGGCNLPCCFIASKSHSALHKFLMEFSLSGRESKKKACAAPLSVELCTTRPKEEAGGSWAEATAIAGHFSQRVRTIVVASVLSLGPFVRERFTLRP